MLLFIKKVFLDLRYLSDKVNDVDGMLEIADAIEGVGVKCCKSNQ